MSPSSAQRVELPPSTTSTRPLPGPVTAWRGVGGKKVRDLCGNTRAAAWARMGPAAAAQKRDVAGAKPPASRCYPQSAPPSADAAPARGKPMAAPPPPGSALAPQLADERVVLVALNCVRGPREGALAAIVPGRGTRAIARAAAQGGVGPSLMGSRAWPSAPEERRPCAMAQCGALGGRAAVCGQQGRPRALARRPPPAAAASYSCQRWLQLLDSAPGRPAPHKFVFCGSLPRAPAATPPRAPT